MRKVLIVLVAAGVFVLPSAAEAKGKAVTRAQARAAMELLAKKTVRQSDERWGIESAHVGPCKRGKRRSWVCELNIVGSGDTGWLNARGEPVIDDYSYFFDYRVSGRCRRARVEILDPWLERPTFFRVCGK